MAKTTRPTKTVYALIDPRDMRVRYIGASVDPENRLGGHMSHYELEENTKRRFLTELREANLKPIIATFGELPIDVAEQVEYQIICAVSQCGHLTNTAGNRPAIQPRHGDPDWHKARDLGRALIELAEGAMA